MEKIEIIAIIVSVIIGIASIAVLIWMLNMNFTSCKTDVDCPGEVCISGKCKNRPSIIPIIDLLGRPKNIRFEFVNPKNIG